MNLRKAVGPLLAVLLLIGVAIAIVFSMRDRKESEISSRRANSRITVKVLTGSEKEKFLTDSDLAKVLDAEGSRLPYKRLVRAKSPPGRTLRASTRLTPPARMLR
ncbi:MAG TPA: hypothetical protein VMT15_07325 [Bryobacteraceae bacterium]|nr:hypothetical protein [Bryobacteraceae bacterium]